MGQGRAGHGRDDTPAGQARVASGRVCERLSQTSADNSWTCLYPTCTRRSRRTLLSRLCPSHYPRPPLSTSKRSRRGSNPHLCVGSTPFHARAAAAVPPVSALPALPPPRQRKAAAESSCTNVLVPPAAPSAALSATRPSARSCRLVKAGVASGRTCFTPCSACSGRLRDMSGIARSTLR